MATDPRPDSKTIQPLGHEPGSIPGVLGQPRTAKEWNEAADAAIKSFNEKYDRMMAEVWAEEVDKLMAELESHAMGGDDG